MLDKVKFRSSSTWKKKRKAILERDHHECLICGNKNNLQVHHIIGLDIEPKLKLDDRNLITLCEHHHNQVHNGVFSSIYLTNLIND